MKKTTAFILALLILLSLCACGKSKEAAAPTPSPEPTEAIKPLPVKNAQPAAVQEETIPEEWAPSSTVKLIISQKTEKATGEALAKIISKYSGQNVSVFSASDTGAELSKAEKNGLTLGLVSCSALGFPQEGDSVKLINIKPVCAISEDAYAIAVREEDSRFSTMEDLAKNAKGLHEPLRISVGAEGSGSHAAAELFADALGIKCSFLHCDTRTLESEALLSGQSDVWIAKLSELEGLEKGKILATFADARMNDEKLAEFPALKELGYEGAVMPSDALCVVLPMGTSGEITAFYEEVLRLALIDPEYTDGDNGIYELWHSPRDTSALAQQWDTFGKNVRKSAVAIEQKNG